ncbi:ALK tyrosine kinase receptor [Hypsibius exemplaris]|uniref:ALK tyrosine kinase receptor n=1 Tax=Hypsibius exemplaris TaxID=2072580 RepID=A0A9X6NE08_HYPEX|nr:ALK tyrosine kinase receptor [Hypsibius exemplaris]
MAVHYALTAVLLVLSVAGVSVCLYMGTRKGSAKCVVRRRAQCLSSCETTFSESERTAIRSPGNGMTNHSSMEINQLYELNGVQRFDDLRKIPRNLIQLKHPLGEGAFGIVYQGTLKSNSEYLPVAVKTLPGCILAESEVDFAAEAVIVCKFHHPNVVQCFGVSFDASPKYIVLELLAGGDVRTFLRRCRSAVDHLTVTTLELLDIVVDIAKGCQYLEQHHFVHRDIAARNCLLTSLTSPRAAKIADFGMARDVVRSDYYRRHSSVLLPVRWMPPEALQEGLFSTKSDIWAFGIFLWEVLSVGCSPYAGLSNQEVIHFVTNGGRLGAPSHFCPPELYDLMRKCWTSVPADRIRFSDVIQTLLGLMGVSSVAAAKVPDEMDSPLPLVQTETTLNTTNNTESVGGTMVDGLPDRTDERENRAHDYHSGTQLLPSNAGQR